MEFFQGLITDYKGVFFKPSRGQIVAPIHIFRVRYFKLCLLGFYISFKGKNYPKNYVVSRGEGRGGQKLLTHSEYNQKTTGRLPK